MAATPTPPSDVLRGTLDLLVLETLPLEPMHGWSISRRIRRYVEAVELILAIR